MKESSWPLHTALFSGDITWRAAQGVPWWLQIISRWPIWWSTKFCSGYNHSGFGLGYFNPSSRRWYINRAKPILSPTLFQSRLRAGKSEECAQQEQQDDQDAKKRYDQAFTITNSVRVEESKLMPFRDAQQANPVLKTFFELPEVELKCKNFGKSPRGILVKVEDDKWRPVVPWEMQ